jgi:hypothetical protein
MICCCCCSTAVVAAGVTATVTVTATTTVTGTAAAGDTAAAVEEGPAAVPAAPAAVTREGEQLGFTIEELLKKILKLNKETGLVLPYISLQYSPASSRSTITFTAWRTITGNSDCLSVCLSAFLST